MRKTIFKNNSKVRDGFVNVYPRNAFGVVRHTRNEAEYLVSTTLPLLYRIRVKVKK